MLRKTFILVSLFSLFVIMTITFENVFAQNLDEVNIDEIEIESEKQAFRLRRFHLSSHSYDRWRTNVNIVFGNEQSEKQAFEYQQERLRIKSQWDKDNKVKILRSRPTQVYINERPLDMIMMGRDINLDFEDLARLWLAGDADSLSHYPVSNGSFYAANLEGAIFDRVHFDNCCFKEANLRNVDTLGTYRGESETVFRNCDFTGAEISGAKLCSISRKQLLSTSNFRQYKDRKRVNLENCTLLGLDTGLAPINSSYNHLRLTGKLTPKEEFFDLSGIDFNKFNNGKPTLAPFHAVGITLGYFKMRECSFIEGNLKDAKFVTCDLEGSNFTKTNLTGSQFGGCVLGKCNFTDAEIKNTTFLDCNFFGYTPKTSTITDWLSAFFAHCRCEDYTSEPCPTETTITSEQLTTTANYKRKELLSIGFGFSDFSGVDFSRFNLTGCSFMGNLQNANFTDAVISGCSFGGCYAPNCDFNTLKTNLTIEQIKSTWNYKTGNMTGIKLPAEIQKVLDAEKQAVKN